MLTQLRQGLVNSISALTDDCLLPAQMPLFLLMLFLFMNTMLSKISEEKQGSPFTETALDEDGKKKKPKKKTNIPLHKFPFSTSALPFNILWERGRGK